MQYDLSTMTMPALLSLQHRVEQALAEYETRKKTQAVRAIIEAAGRHGFTPTDLFGAAAVKKLQEGPREKAPKPAKIIYRNPDNSDETWTGRGRKPKWLKAELKAGRALDDYRI